MESKQALSAKGFWGIAFCFLLSGFAALLYETVWLREFSIHFGTSEQALAIVLGTYMGGLALGAILAARFADSIRRPLLTYASLELGIAVTALLVPTLLGLVRTIQIAATGGADQPPAASEMSQILFSLLGASVATVLPTTMMGATLPLLAKHAVEDDSQLGPRIGALYMINTLGAVLGTLCAAFVLLPALGLRQTVFVGAAVNALIFIAVWSLLRNQSIDVATTREPFESASEIDENVSLSQPGRAAILWLIAISGGVSFGYEILFTRMLGHFLGGSVFAFASMLASFLLGIALGAGVAAKLSRNREIASYGFVIAQCLTAVLALGSWYGLEHFAQWLNELAIAGEPSSLPRALIAMIILLPPAISIGATFPFAIRIHARGRSDAATSSAKIYACSTLGGVSGALLVGHVLLPATSYQWTAAILMLTSLLIATFALVCMELGFKVFIPVGIGLLLIAIGFPSLPTGILRVSPFDGVFRSGNLVFSKTGRSATVTVYNDLGLHHFLSGGLPEAGTLPPGSLARPQGASAWLGLLPVVTHPKTESMLIVGFGSGAAALHVPSTVKEIDLFELEQAVIDANQFVRNKRVKDPLADPRVNVILNDGRSGLALTDKKFDAIVSQPSHPWTAGASHLYTQQFVRLAHDHLTDTGVFVQWVAITHIDESLLRSLAATLCEVFPSVHLFQPNQSSLLFLATRQPWELPSALPTFSKRRDKDLLASMGLQSIADLIALRSIDDEGLRSLSANHSANTDNNNRLALKSFPSDQGLNLLQIESVVSAHDPLLTSDDPPDEMKSVLARRRHQRGRRENAEMLARAIGNEAMRLRTEADLRQKNQDLEKAKELYKKCLQLDPSQHTARVSLYCLSRLDPDFDEASFWQDAGGDESLTKPQRALVLAQRMLAPNPEQPNASIAIDAALKNIPSTDELYSTTMLQRIRLRIIDPALGTPRERGREALSLIDRVLPYLQIADVNYYRLEAAVLANQPNVALQTAKSIAVTIGTEPNSDRTDPAAIELQLSMLRRCNEVLVPMQGSRSIDQQQLLSVLQLISQKAEGLQ